MAAHERRVTRPTQWLYAALATLVLVAIIVGLALLLRLPPRVVIMSTGMPGSDYDLYAQRYRAILKRSGVELRLMPSGGGVENLRRLNDRRSGVSVAFAQSGLTKEELSPGVQSLGTMFYQPFWFFVRGSIPSSPRELLQRGTLSIGPEGDGTRVLAAQMLALNGVDLASLHTVALPAQQSAAALLKGNIAAAAMVASWDTAAVRGLLASSDVSAVSFPRSDAYVALYPFLTKLTLPTGVGNMATNRPASDVTMVAPKASLLIREDLSPAIQYLLLEAASEVHSQPGIFQRSGQFPAPEEMDLPVSKEARQYYKSGSPFLQRYLPFWLAVLVSRLLVLLVPVVGVAYPMLRGTPALYRWSMRRRVLKLYGELKLIEVALESHTAATTAELLGRLERLEQRANRLYLPLTFAPSLYELRDHIALVRSRLTHAQASAAALNSP